MERNSESNATSLLRAGRCAAGWIAVCASSLLTCLWTYWGIVENFYEGWYYPSLWQNLRLAEHYLMVPFGLMLLALVSGRRPRVGGILHVCVAAGALIYFGGATGSIVMIAIPLCGLGVLYWFAKVPSRKWILLLVAGFPLATLIGTGSEPAWRVSTRVFDGYRGARLVEGNGVRLIWAPAGPGWPQHGGDWPGAVSACRRLSADGTRLAGTPQNVWRLPTVEEAVRSFSRHGANAGGVWEGGKAIYRVRPDKESPLWDIYSPIIYWWTATEINDREAWMVSFSGLTLRRSKAAHPDYYGFRCVRNAYSPAAGHPPSPVFSGRDLTRIRKIA